MILTSRYSHRRGGTWQNPIQDYPDDRTAARILKQIAHHHTLRPRIYGWPGTNGSLNRVCDWNDQILQTWSLRKHKNGTTSAYSSPSIPTGIWITATDSGGAEPLHTISNAYMDTVDETVHVEPQHPHNIFLFLARTTTTLWTYHA
jgi:hypothetical protein